MIFRRSCGHLSILRRRAVEPALHRAFNASWRGSGCSTTSHSFSYLVTQQRAYISLPDVLLDEDDYQDLPPTIGNLPVAHLVRGRYISPWSKKTEKTPWAVIQWLMSRKQEKLKFPKDLKSSIDAVLNKIPLEDAVLSSREQLHFTWLGHATCFFQSGGLFFMTDPVLFSERASPFQFIGPKRIMTPALDEIKSLLLPKLNVVLLSHTHYDHLDHATAMLIGNKPLWVVPLGVKALLRGWGITNVVELNWWDKHRIELPIPSAASSDGKEIAHPKMSEVEVVFTPTKHWTSRTPFDRNTCLWGSYVIASPQGRVFFGGDSAYCSVFKQIGELYGPFDVAALSIGAYKPRWFMKDVHCNPEEAVQMHLDLRSKRSVGIHWGTFPLADEDDIEPALELAVHRERRGVGECGFHTMGMGETMLPGTRDGSSEVDATPPPYDIAARYPKLLQHYVEHCEAIEKKQRSKKGAMAGSASGSSGGGGVSTASNVAAVGVQGEAVPAEGKGRVIVGQEPKSPSFTVPAVVVPPPTTATATATAPDDSAKDSKAQ